MQRANAKRIDQSQVQAIGWNRLSDLVDLLVAVADDDNGPPAVWCGSRGERRRVLRIEVAEDRSSKRNLGVPESDERAPIHELSALPEASPARSRKEVDESSSTGSAWLHVLASDLTGRVDVPAEEVVLLLRPSADALDRVPVVARLGAVAVRLYAARHDACLPRVRDDRGAGTRPTSYHPAYALQPTSSRHPIA